MEIKIAEHAGFCFGVKKAVDTVYDLAKDPENGRIVTLGHLIHNEHVIDELKSDGVYPVESVDEIPDGATAVIRSHGVPESVILDLEKKGIPYRDLTCPFVKKIHDIVRKRSLEGDEIVIIGSPGHPEVKGILGWSVCGGTVLETYEQAEGYVPSDTEKKVCVVAQTTFSLKKFQDYVEIFEKKEYDINVVNTICHATMERKTEAEALAKASDAMIVIGGAESSNSRKLYELCKKQCENTFFIQTADALEDISFKGYASLGITAGASTPNTLIQEVFKACQRK